MNRGHGRRHLATIVALALAVVLGAGCHGMRPPPGSGGNEQVSGAHQKHLAAQRVVEEVQRDGRVAADVPPELKKSGLRVSTSAGYPPMELFDDDGKSIIGLDPSLARALGNVLGVKATVKNEDFNAQIPGVISGRYDVVMSSVTDNAERRAKATMVDYAEPGQAFIVGKGNPSGVKKPRDVCGKTLSVVDNGSALGYAEDFSKACVKRGAKPAKILKFTGDDDALLQVRSGRADADINDYPVAAYRAATSRGRLDLVAIPGTEAPFGIVVKPSRKDLVDVLRKAMDVLIRTGAYERILRAWDVEDMATDRAKVNGGK